MALNKLVVAGVIGTSGTATAVTANEIVKSVRSSKTQTPRVNYEEALEIDEETYSNADPEIVSKMKELESLITDLRAEFLDEENEDDVLEAELKDFSNPSSFVSSIQPKSRETRSSLSTEGEKDDARYLIRELSKMFVGKWAQRTKNKNTCEAKFVIDNHSNLDNLVKFIGEKLSRTVIETDCDSKKPNRKTRILFVRKNNNWRVKVVGKGENLAPNKK